MAKILIVDDSAISRSLSRKILEKTEHEIVGEADCGEKAILEVKRLSPDIIMMDLDMPGMGGLEASIKIKKYDPKVKIIIVSAHDQSSITDELKQHGLVHFTSKPIKPDKVLNALFNVLSLPQDSQGEDVISDILPENEDDLFIGLDIKEGTSVIITHFSTLQDLKAQILLKDKNQLTVKFIKDYSLSNLSVGEPMTICFEAKNEAYICEANIRRLNLTDKSLKVHITKIDRLQSEQLLELFPTSIAVNIKEEFQAKNMAAIIKNIGVYELQVIVNSEIVESSKVILDIYLDSKAFNIRAEISGKVKHLYNYEYKVKVSFIDLGSKRFLSSYILRQRNQRLQSVLRLSND